MPLKELLELLFMAQANGNYCKLISKLARADLLILNDWVFELLNARNAEIWCGMTGKIMGA